MQQTNSYQSYEKPEKSNKKAEVFKEKETNYIIDYLSEINNELMSIETGYGTTRTTYGHISERLNQKVTIFTETPKTVRTEIAKENQGKTYFQSDLLGSVLFASNQEGEVLRYAERDIWGNLRRPVQNDVNFAGIENNIQFTNYTYDPVIDKHYAGARFYDSEQGRMLNIDPMKAGYNAYTYCMNNPINYRDPDGEIASSLFLAAAETVLGGAFRLTDYISKQKAAKQKVNPVKAIKETVSGMVKGAVTGFVSGLNPATAASSLTNLVSKAVVRGVQNKKTTGKINLGSIAKEGLYDRYGGRPTETKPVSQPTKTTSTTTKAKAKPTKTTSTVAKAKSTKIASVVVKAKSTKTPSKATATTKATTTTKTSNNKSIKTVKAKSIAKTTKVAVKPKTTPSAAPKKSNKDPKAACGGSGNGYGYNYETSSIIKSATSLANNLKERWSDPINVIDDVGLAISLVGVGAYGINKIGKAISTLKNGKNLANVANSTQGKLPMNLQYFAKKRGGKLIFYQTVLLVVKLLVIQNMDYNKQLEEMAEKVFRQRQS